MAEKESAETPASLDSRRPGAEFGCMARSVSGILFETD